MKHYRVLLEGEPVTLEADGQRQELGFVVTRFVQAQDSDAAAAYAMQLVRNDPKLQRAAGTSELERLCIRIGEVEEISSEESNRPQPEFAFYPADGSYEEESLITSWLAMARAPEGSDELAIHLWAHNSLSELVDTEPETAWPLILKILSRERDEEVLV